MTTLIAIVYRTATREKIRHILDDADDGHIERVRANLRPDESLLVIPLAAFPVVNGQPNIAIDVISAHAGMEIKP